MGSLYIGIIMLCRVVQQLFNKRTSQEVKGFRAFVQYGAYRNLMSAVPALILLLLLNGGLLFEPKTVLIATASGVMLFISLICGQTVLRSCPMSLASLVATAGLLVPCIAGIFLFHQPMSYLQWAGVLLFLIGAYFLIGSSGNVYGKLSWKTILLLIGEMLSNGGTMLAQRAFTYYVPDGNVSAFSFYSFSVVGVILLVMACFMPAAADEPKMLLSKRVLWYGAVLSLMVFLINQLATLATALVHPAVLFTFINGGNTFIAAIVGWLVFREKMTPKGIFGMLTGICALVILSL